MTRDAPWTVKVQNHPGSSEAELQNESDWYGKYQHRIGFKNRQGHVPGITHKDDDHQEEQQVNGTLSGKHDEKLIDFRNIARNPEAQHAEPVEDRPWGWRDVIEYTEDWVKYSESWPVNDKKQSKTNESQNEKQTVETKDENQWRRENGDKGTHHQAYGSGKTDDDKSQQKSEYEKLLEQYTPQEIALLRALQHESRYRDALEENNGTNKSPQTHNRSSIAIDEKDQFTPDNWLPRSDDLIRLTGNHPMNAEPDLTLLLKAGLVTPNELHYVRNHGPVPRILWENHRLEVNADQSKLTYSMDGLISKFKSINIPIAITCDGNRRKEMNMTRMSKGFSWGAGATGCAYWKGVLLRDVLLAAGVNNMRSSDGKPRWVNFEGADEPSEGKYATSIPLGHVMEETNDVMLAYEMNDVPLPPDHGYPLRLIVPGYVGGRNIKWLARIWLSDEENSSHYHIWDNRVVPSFITAKDGEFAKTMFSHPDTACYEQNLNSIIVKPEQNEKLSLAQAKKGDTYRISGYAYDGGGHEVQRVEISLDGGKTWLYCIRQFPDQPIRHGNRFWTWLHWHVDVSMVHLLQAENITVRCWNVFKNTQPETLNWNVMGMMNNCWYVVKAEISQDEGDDGPVVLFRHPCEPTGDGGWMKPSIENQIVSAKREAAAPTKKFTREEIEKHDNQDDCWLIIDNKVYDATSVLSWHPGGSAAILEHAGKVHQDTSDQFSSIHDDYAYQKLEECALGVVTDKVAKFIKAEAEEAAKQQAKEKMDGPKVALQKHRWVPVTLKSKKELSEDTRRYTFSLPDGEKNLGLGTCQHIQFGFHMQDKMVIRNYTPTMPLLPPSTGGKTNGPASGEVAKLQDGHGTFELVVKTYFPSDQVPGGAMSNLLDCMQVGDTVEIKGPTGEITYEGNGRFNIEDEEQKFSKVSLVLGGSGLTPGYALVARAIASSGDNVEVRVVDANKTQKDILLHDELSQLVKESKGRLKITHVLSHPSDDWKGLKGHVNAQILKDSLFPPAKDSVVFLCGPPAMIQKVALPALKDWGYVENENLFGF